MMSYMAGGLENLRVGKFRLVPSGGGLEVSKERHERALAPLYKKLNIKPVKIIRAKGFPEPMKFNSKERTSDPSTIGVYKTRIK